MLFFIRLFPIKTLLLVVSTFAGFLLSACSGMDQSSAISANQATITVIDVQTTVDDLLDAEANNPGLSNNPETSSPPRWSETSTSYPTRKPPTAYADLEIIILLPPDAIQAINNPQFLPVEEADKFYDPQEMVMGVSFNGDSRAYSAPFLSSHEIVNDTVGGVKIAVTW